MMKLEELQVDTHVAGIEPSTPVKLLSIRVAGEDAADVNHEPHDGHVPRTNVGREAGLRPGGER